MSALHTVVLWLDEIGKDAIPSVGGKAASLGDLSRTEIPVPPGFVVTAETYRAFIETAQLGEAIHHRLDALHVDDTERLHAAAHRMKRLVTDAEVPNHVVEAILTAYQKLGRPLVAVRASGVATDLPDASFAGKLATYLNISGEQEVVTAVKRCWASLFNPQAIFYRTHQGYDHLSVASAVIVQQMVQPEVSGVMFTAEPLFNDPSQIVVEAMWGTGETAVTGAITPDLYCLDKASLTILDRKVAVQEWKLGRQSGTAPAFETTTMVSVPAEEGACQKLRDSEVRALARLGKQVERHFGSPQELEWAKEQRTFFILQARPVVTMEAEAGMRRGSRREMTGKLLLSGAPASPGVTSGPVKIIDSVRQIGQMEEGDVLVTSAITPDFLPAMKRAVAVITDKGNYTSHAAALSHELGIPCVVGTETGTRVLKRHQRVTVDGTWGKVLEGEVVLKTGQAARAQVARSNALAAGKRDLSIPLNIQGVDQR